MICQSSPVLSHHKALNNHCNLDYLLASNGYVINLASNGISGNALLYFTRHTSSDLKTQKLI